LFVTKATFLGGGGGDGPFYLSPLAMPLIYAFTRLCL